jgi:hypothetical protein
MRRLFSPARSSRHGSLIVLAACLAFGHAAQASPLKARTADAAKKIQRDQDRYRDARFKPVDRELVHPGKTKRVFPARVKGGDKQSVFVRIPRYGAANAMRRHNFVRTLAEQLGRPDLVPPAALVTLGEDIGDGKIKIGKLTRSVQRGDTVMVVEDAGEGFVNYKQVEGQGASAVPEDLRVDGALMHLLSWQLDGNLSNLLVRLTPGRAATPADVRLLDHDVTLGVKHTGPRVNGSLFFPGESLAFAGAQARFADLPARGRELVDSLAGASEAEIAAAYGIDEVEASYVRTAAVDVRSVGLARAIKRFEAKFPAMHDVEYHQRKTTLPVERAP